MDNSQDYLKFSHSYSGAFGKYDLAPNKMNVFYSNKSNSFSSDFYKSEEKRIEEFD